ncbi:hypothetical protein HK100_007526, partial [Physocladia obscura]
MDVLAGTNLGNYIMMATQRTRWRAINVRRKTVSLPLNWGGPLGEMHGLDIKDAYLSMEDMMHKNLGVERETYKEMITEAFHEWRTARTFV